MAKIAEIWIDVCECELPEAGAAHAFGHRPNYIRDDHGDGKNRSVIKALCASQHYFGIAAPRYTEVLFTPGACKRAAAAAHEGPFDVDGALG